jgi:hypothetical protein
MKAGVRLFSPAALPALVAKIAGNYPVIMTGGNLKLW